MTDIKNMGLGEIVEKYVDLKLEYLKLIRSSSDGMDLQKRQVLDERINMCVSEQKESLDELNRRDKALRTYGFY